MFDLSNWSNPETLALNITNAALGLVLVGAVVFIGWKALHEFFALQAKNHHGKH